MSDQHVIPDKDTLEHEASPQCWCEPRVDDGVPHPSGDRVWIHKTWRECFADRDADQVLDAATLMAIGNPNPDNADE